MGDVAALLAEVRSGQSRLLLGRALGAVDLLVAAMGRAQPSLTLYPAGALRRFEPTVGDLLVLAAGDEPRAAVTAWADGLPATDVRWRSRDAVTFLWDGEEITLRAVADAALGAALVHYSGSREHVAQLAGRARERGLRLTPAGLVDVTRHVRPASSEAAVYAALDSPWISAGAAARPRRGRACGTRRVSAGRRGGRHPGPSAHAHGVERRPRHHRDGDPPAWALGYRYPRHHRPLTDVEGEPDPVDRRHRAASQGNRGTPRRPTRS